MLYKSSSKDVWPDRVRVLHLPLDLGSMSDPCPEHPLHANQLRRDQCISEDPPTKDKAGAT